MGKAWSSSCCWESACAAGTSPPFLKAKGLYLRAVGYRGKDKNVGLRPGLDCWFLLPGCGILHFFLTSPSLWFLIYKMKIMKNYPQSCCEVHMRHYAKHLTTNKFWTDSDYCHLQLHLSLLWAPGPLVQAPLRSGPMPGFCLSMVWVMMTPYLVPARGPAWNQSTENFNMTLGVAPDQIGPPGRMIAVDAAQFLTCFG